MLASKKQAALISKLLELTQHDKIEWRIESPPRHLLPADERVALVYCSEYLDQGLRIYKYEYKYWNDDEAWEWQVNVRLELVDSEDRALYSIEGAGLEHLLQAIQYQTADVDRFLEKLGVR